MHRRFFNIAIIIITGCLLALSPTANAQDACQAAFESNLDQRGQALTDILNFIYDYQINRVATMKKVNLELGGNGEKMEPVTIRLIREYRIQNENNSQGRPVTIAGSTTEKMDPALEGTLVRLDPENDGYRPNTFYIKGPKQYSGFMSKDAIAIPGDDNFAFYPFPINETVAFAVRTDMDDFGFKLEKLLAQYNSAVQFNEIDMPRDNSSYNVRWVGFYVRARAVPPPGPQ